MDKEIAEDPVEETHSDAVGVVPIASAAGVLVVLSAVGGFLAWKLKSQGLTNAHYVSTPSDV